MVMAGIGVAAAEHYAKVAEIKIGGAGAFDYLTVDSAAKRLYVTHGTEIVVIDLATNAIVGRIADTPRVHGIAIGANGRGFTSNGGENKVGIVDLKTLATLSKVDTGANPDAILYVPSRKEVYAFNHTGESATIIDAEKGTAITTVKLGGQAETGQADAALGKVFVNIEDKSTVDVIDMATHAVVATWPVAPAEEPTGMAIDTASHRVFVGGGPSLVMLDANSGKVVASVPPQILSDASTLPLLASSITSDGPPPTNTRWVAVSMAIPVGSSAGATGHVATTVCVAMSITSTVLLSSMLTNTLPSAASACPVSAWPPNFTVAMAVPFSPSMMVADSPVWLKT